MTKNIVYLIVLILAGYVLAYFYSLNEKLAPISPNPNPPFHFSYFTQPQFYDQAYDMAKKAPVQPGVKGIVVNHHLLAANFIAETFNVVATDAPLTVLLVSPNHFDVGKSQIITTSASWKTPYGDLQPDLDLIEGLKKAGLADTEDQPFEQEHGVSGIVAFIKKSLPNAKVVPVIFKTPIPVPEAQRIAGRFNELLPANTLVVGSFDFSHYLTSRAADFHDINSLAALQNFDFGKINNLDTDSRPGLAFFLELLKDQGTQNFHLLENSNSSKLARQDILETTSYINGYFTAGTSASPSPNTLLSLPSIYISPQVSSAVNKNSPFYALTYMQRLLYGQDKTAAFVNNPSDDEKSLLARFGIIAVLEGVYDYELGPKKIKIVDCTKEPSGVNKYIDEGTDVVICQGAHKSSMKFYKNKPIVYASGNFLDKKAIYKGQTSLAVGLAYSNGKLQIYLLPIGGDGRQIKLLVGEENGTVLKEMAQMSQAPQEIKKQIQTGVIIIKD